MLSDKRIGCWRCILLFLTASTLLVATAGILVISQVHEFLSIDAPVQADTIVLYGSMPDAAMEKIARTAAASHHIRILTVGGPIGRGSHLSAYQDYASLAAASLRSLGVPEDAIAAIPAPASHRDRVFASAVALRTWLQQSDREIEAVDVYAEGVRARRTLILFTEALGPDVEVGIVSVPDEGYDSSAWWSTSEGFRTVLSESLAYFYVKTFFRPER